MNGKRGYSLIELLIVVVLVAILSVTATSFLFTSLRGTGQASGLAVIKQNGDHAIGVIERAVRSAQDREVECGIAGDSLILTEGDGTDTTFDDTITTFSIVSNRVEITVETIGPPLITTSNFITSDQIIAELPDCEIIQGTIDKPDIAEFSFQLRIGNLATDRPSEVAVERFQTRVSTRTY